jgi:hypothetical protein
LKSPATLVVKLVTAAAVRLRISAPCMTGTAKFPPTQREVPLNAIKSKERGGGVVRIDGSPDR